VRCATGPATGLLGAVPPPVAGAVDLATQTHKGAGNTVSYLPEKNRYNVRVRPRRFIGPDKQLCAYNHSQAVVQARQQRRKSFDLSLKKKIIKK
jgi:hypothetical protein